MPRTPLKRQVCYNGTRGKYGFIIQHNTNLMDHAAHFDRPLGGPPVNYGEMLLEYHRIELYRRVSPAMRRDFYTCDDCGLPWRDNPGPMLQNMVWLRIAKKKELLCHDCTCKRLGRPVCMHDLVVCEFNFTTWEKFTW